MQKVSKEIESYLKSSFQNVRETESGFRINVQQLEGKDFELLGWLHQYTKLTVKRSGTGLVIIVDPQD